MRGTRSAVRKLSPRRMSKITFWWSNILDHRFNRNRVRKITDGFTLFGRSRKQNPEKLQKFYFWNVTGRDLWKQIPDKNTE